MRLPPLALTVLASLVTPAISHGIDISQDTTWTGTISVDEDLLVSSGVPLTVAAGSEIQIANDVTLRVRGRLMADGTEGEPIRFTRQSGGSQWKQILFLDFDASRLSHCIVEYADCEGDHKDYDDDKDASCNPITERPPRDYNETIAVISSHVDFDACTFENLPDGGSNAEGDAIAVISDDIEVPGPATAHITRSSFVGIGQGIHTRYS